MGSETGEVSRVENVLRPVGYMKKFELDPKSDEEPLKDFKQKSDMKGHL